MNDIFGLKIAKELMYWYSLDEKDPLYQSILHSWVDILRLGHFCDELEKLNGHDDFMGLKVEDVEQLCRRLAKEYGYVKLKDFMVPLRAAICGSPVGPSLYHIIAFRGKKDIITRIQNHVLKLSI